ncbi:hypothetical protein GAO09_01185 [Rhizobiales bacterium RZME27]|uniref:Yip1 domain-containing protein n=1 Tax=Endobacterium cereale TaxID=2663029 RepID=A0A6A8A5Z9_9HYPH|nr:hypothetical protein [Endobacterium cereale]MEB2844769.1 hypothetical protein [Endobacterium cereale]MQY44686.1 hypothetical protein [Endobacterium cereale]
MPSFTELQHYISGLWLLVKGDAQGFRRLDLTDRGMNRSFWAIVWCLPPMLISWNWARLAVLEDSPPGTKLGLPFFFKLGLIDAMNWIMPLILVAVLCMTLGLRGRFPAIVAISNWLSVPFSYGYAVLIVIAFLLPGSEGFVALLWLALLLGLVFSLSRILRMILGPQPLIVATTAMTLIIPSLLLSDALQSFLGVAP